MEALVDDGKCRHIGVSNFSTTKLQALVKTARIKPEMNQIELHPYLQQPSMLAFCQENNIYLTAYSPLGSSDRPNSLRTDDEPVLLEDAAIASIAKTHGATPAQILISWAIHRGTAVIQKSVNPARIKQNLAAAELSLTPEDMQTITALNLNRRYVDGTIWVVDRGSYTLATLWDS